MVIETPTPTPTAALPRNQFDGLIQMRPFATPALREAMGARSERFFGRLSPDSVLVTAIGNHWQPEAWARVSDMVVATNKAGIQCGLQELQDRCLNWGDALGTMRTDALLMAANEGFEWICYVDNDVQPEPDTLLKLLRRGCSVIAPYVEEPAPSQLGQKPRTLHSPEHQKYTGLHPVRWAVLSMLLMRTAVFHCTGPNFWRDAIGADEGIHFAILWWYGHVLNVDTDIVLRTTKPPTYPLASNRMSEEEREKYWAQKRHNLVDNPPDRRPVTVPQQNIIDGAYMPFLPPQQPPNQPQAGGNGKIGQVAWDAMKGGKW